jgi:hypothetical protein
MWDCSRLPATVHITQISLPYLATLAPSARLLQSVPWLGQCSDVEGERQNVIVQHLAYRCKKKRPVRDARAAKLGE